MKQSLIVTMHGDTISSYIKTFNIKGERKAFCLRRQRLPCIVARLRASTHERNLIAKFSWGV
jgi:hypothetical protein